jgi:dTDP-4-amino-4,6-dideoxygalactose transaminase
VLATLGYGVGSFPQTERLAARSLSLPMYPELPLDQLDRVATVVRDWVTAQAG